jgi:hypothetical protein
MQNLKLRPRRRTHEQYVPLQAGLRAPGTEYAVSCGSRIQIGGNIRDVMREYPGRKWAASRLFPDIPAYSRIVGFREFQMQNSEGKTDEHTGGSVRFGPPGTAWDRINFFLRVENGVKNRPGGLSFSQAGTPPVVGPSKRAPFRNMPPGTTWSRGSARRVCDVAGGFRTGNSPGRRPALQSEGAVPHAEGQP